ncbi:signal transduction histidine kinase [Chitinophaga skermanii]|uniref:histidine kinase n=1 Tax=Chitinophaga skermanii TaxID=331697 RepID=A0A327QEE3_9BACT|nr:ATP-binding protein [Chitinophaga skermanii]RAJ01643.1 signal transduction histidine kinase [Chitinophaga skermanii]
MKRLRLKTKITLGVLFLFAMLMVVSVLGFYYLNMMSKNTKEILKDNYESIEYAKNITQSLDLFDNNAQQSLSIYQKNLSQQEENVTEPGEVQATGQLRAGFDSLKAHLILTPELENNIKQNAFRVIDLNMAAITAKNDAAKKASDKALMYIAIIGGVCFLLGISFVYNFPGYIADPIQALTEGIKGISEKNYEQRLHFSNNDEFGELATAFNTMAQKLDEYEHSNLARIVFEKKRVEAVISSLKDATIGLDEKGIMLFANTLAVEMLNIAEKDMVGKPATQVAQHNDLLQTLINKQDNAPLKIVVNNKEGFYMKETANIVHDQQHIGTVIILRNITTFKEQDLAKTHFIATISHELKTPLAASDFSLKLLEDKRVGELNTEQSELVDSLKQDNKRMIRIVSELLDFSQVESGKIQLQIQPVQASDIIHYAMNTVQKEAENKNISIQTSLPPNPPALQADAEKTAWVLVNLLTNAIRYSAAGKSIQLNVAANEHQLTFSVVDHGKGIDPSFKEKIFERFFQVPGVSDGKGSGLGLAIAKEFIEAQGGSIGVQSDIGMGSTFYFSLPVA